AAAATRGGNPLSREPTGSPSNWSHSLQRQSDGTRAPIASRSGRRRAGSYTGSSGPRHASQIATGAAWRSAPQLRQRSGRAASESRQVTGAAVMVIETSKQKPRAHNTSGGRLLYSSSI